MPQDRYFLTGDAVFDANWQVIVTIPKSQGNWVYGVFLGYLQLLSQTWPWVTGGESTPQDAATIFQTIYDGIIPNVITIGDIKWSAVNLDSSSGWLACNGALLAISDYPVLYGAILTAFNQPGDPSGFFRVPDLRGRTMVGPDNGASRITQPGNNTLGGSFGIEAVQLTVPELASHTHTAEPHSHATTPHTHSEGNTVPIGVAPPVPPAVLPAALGSVGITGPGSDTILDAGVTIDPTGGDTAHLNLQPSMVLYAYILAVI